MNSSRREFLKLSAMGAGTIAATAALPAFAEDNPLLFPGRGRFERLALSYQHVRIGLEKPFSILHISDSHLTAVDGRETSEFRKSFAAKRIRVFGGRQEDALFSSLAWAKKNVDYVIHTGDLIDFQTEANLDLVRKAFGENPALTGSVGNHEYQRRLSPDEKFTNDTAFNEPSYATLSSAYPFDLALQSTVVNGVNFVTIDQVYGTVTEKQVERFGKEIEKGLPVVLCMHVPFVTEHIWRSDMKFWRNVDRKFRSAALPDPSGDYKRQTEDRVTADFIKYLKGEKLLKAILSGHLHITVQDRFSPTAMQYVVGGNFMFHGEEILFS